jgi:pectate lyase
MFIKQLLALSMATSVLATPAFRPSRLTKLNRRADSFPLPASEGSETFDEPYVISGNQTYDGGMKTFGRGVSCSEGEGGDSDAVFSVEDGGTLKNAIIGADQIEGVHCQGSCTIENVWWEAVCEGMSPKSHEYMIKPA